MLGIAQVVKRVDQKCCMCRDSLTIVFIGNLGLIKLYKDRWEGPQLGHLASCECKFD